MVQRKPNELQIVDANGHIIDVVNSQYTGGDEANGLPEFTESPTYIIDYDDGDEKDVDGDDNGGE